MFCTGLGFHLPRACEVPGSLPNPREVPWDPKEHTPPLSPLPCLSVCAKQGTRNRAGCSRQSSCMCKTRGAKRHLFREREWRSCASGAAHAGANTRFPSFSFFCRAWKENISGNNRMNYNQDRKAKPIQSEGSNWVGKGFSLVSTIPTWKVCSVDAGELLYLSKRQR